MRTDGRIIHRILALTLLLALGLSAPAGAAGFFDWLTGGDEEASETPAATLPPADALWLPEAPEPEPLETPEATPAVTPAPIPDATIEDDGMLRVELRSLDAPTQLHLTLAGVYAVEGDPGFRFERDTRLTLSAAQGSVYLSVGGLILDMGTSMTLTRHTAPEGAENGLYIDESEKDTLYCGDLTVSVASEDALRAVLRIQIEDYLYGVVAYEMSDSFPIEALKAQAVAARTYAMQRKWQSGGRDYDVADTTADQVFKGYDPEYVNVIQAVDVTRGVVGIYDGGFAICYYTASNGGQTALPGQVLGASASDAYLAMKDDPYDLENPRSLQNELTVTDRCEGSVALREMLEAALGERLRADGYGDGEWELDSIASIEPVNPRFGGSRMYDGLSFALRARLLVPVQTPTPEPTDTPEPAEAVENTDAPEAADEAGEAVAATDGDGSDGEPEDKGPANAAEADGEADPLKRPEPEKEDDALEASTATAGATADPAAVDAQEPTPDQEETATPAATADPEAADALAAALTGQIPEASATPEPTPEPTPVPREWVLSDTLYTVTLDVYDQIKDGLKLGLNGMDCELISIETQLGGDGRAESFTLIMRRFGHGAGMSQRGAQWMAGHYGMYWRDILAFYYPGLSFERMNWPENALTSLEALPDSVGAARPRPTPTPTPAPLPELEEGERYATVTANSLNVRQQPTTASMALDQLARGRRVIVVGEPDADGWVSIRTAELEGYVKAEYLE